MKKTLLLLLLCAFSSQLLLAQPVRGVTLKAKQETADKLLKETDYYNAEIWAAKVLEENKDDVATTLILAQSQYGLRDYRRAETSFKKLLNKDRKTQKYQDYRFYYAQCLKKNGKLDEAEQEFENFINNSAQKDMATLAEAELAGIELARTLQADPNVGVENLGKGVNSAYSELSPYAISATDIYYSSLSSDVVIELNDDGTAKGGQEMFSKIYRATKDGDKWEKGEALGTTINKYGSHAAHIALSEDGNTLYFSRCNLDGSAYDCAIYMSTKKDGNWSEAQKIEGGVNGEYTSKQPAYAKINGKDAIIFASDMANGKGGFDLYYAVKSSGNTFGTPVNLGAPVNTLGHEETPFVQGGNLYFSSTGHPGLGGKDVFAADMSGVTFSNIKNLGATVNSSVDDWYYSVDNSGYNAYFSSNRKGGKSVKSPTCCYDIYSVSYPIPVIVDINALTFDEKKNKLDGVTVQLIDITNNKTDSKSNERSNNFPWKDVTKGTTYKLIAKKEGYEDAVQEISTADITESKTIDVDLWLTFIPPPPPPPKEIVVSVPPEKPIPLGNILYKFDSDIILESSIPQLDLLVELMQDFPDITKVELSAHTDSRGGAPYNKALSERRAIAAMKYLTDKGISPSRIVAVGKGESEIRNQCVDGVKCSDEEHQVNRRVELKILEGRKTVPAKYFLEHLQGR